MNDACRGDNASRHDPDWKRSISEMRAASPDARGARPACKPARLLGRDGAGRLGQALDPLLDVPERLAGWFQSRCREFPAARPRQSQSRRLSRSSTSCRPLAVRNSRLARRSLGSCRRSSSPCSTRRSSRRTSEIGCNSSTSARSTWDKPFLLPQPKQHDPLRARGAAALGAMIDIVAQQARAFDKLRNELAFQIERHRRCPVSQSFPIV